MTVTISNGRLAQTNNAFCADGTMLDMRGKRYKIDEVRHTDYGTAALINGFIWHPADLIEDSYISENKSEPFHFNIEELVT